MFFCGIVVEIRGHQVVFCKIVEKFTINLITFGITSNHGEVVSLINGLKANHLVILCVDWQNFEKRIAKCTIKKKLPNNHRKVM